MFDKDQLYTCWYGVSCVARYGDWDLIYLNIARVCLICFAFLTKKYLNEMSRYCFTLKFLEILFSLKHFLAWWVTRLCLAKLPNLSFLVGFFCENHIHVRWWQFTVLIVAIFGFLLTTIVKNCEIEREQYLWRHCLQIKTWLEVNQQFFL